MALPASWRNTFRKRRARGINTGRRTLVW
ncbi:hypothetical protein [Paracoccus sp. (in: a-proteobacteria)]